MLGQMTTARQRQYATALGISFSEETTREELSKLIDIETRRQEHHNANPNPGQLHFIQQYRLREMAPRAEDSANDARIEISNFLNAKAWGLSCIRHGTGVDFRYYREMRISETTVNDLTCRFFKAGMMIPAEKGNAVDGDLWYKIEEFTEADPAYQFVSNLDLPEEAFDSLKEACKESVLKEYGQANVHSAKTQRELQGSGCSVPFCLMIFIALALMFYL